MISKEIVVSWFKGLSGDDRIDLMCLLVDYCLPSELRFIGTYLEAAAQKDYYGFRTYESAANNPTDLSYMYLLEDSSIRRRLCLYIALLHSSNRQAAAVLFGILNDFHPSGLLDEEVLTELSLLYTLTANHPAFSFHQKHVLRSKLKLLRLQSVTTTSDLGETVSDCSTGSSTFLLDAESQSFFPVESPVSSNSSGLDTNEDEKLEEVEPVKTEKKTSEELPAIPENPPKVFVKEIKVLNIQKKVETKQKHESKKKKDYEYVIEVTWSDDTNDKIHRSYEEMFDFQCKLRKMYPNKVDENGQPWKLPFLPGRIRIFNKAEHKGERTPIPDIGDYARLFASLPKFVRGCEHVLNFFHNNEKSKNRDKKSKSAKKEEKAKAKQESLKNNKPNDTKQNENKPNETISKDSHKNGVSDSTTKQNEDITEQIIDKEKQKETDNNKEKLAQDVIGKSIDWSEITDHNANHLTSSINGDSAPEDKRSDLDPAVSVATSLEGKNGIIKLNSLQKSTLSVTPPVGPVLTTTPVSNNNLYSIHSTILFTSQNNQYFSNPGPLHNSHSSLNMTSSTVTNTFMPSRPFAVRPSVSAPVTSPIESPHVFPSHSHAFNRRSSTGSWSFRAPACSLTVQDWLKNLRLHKYSETFKGKTFNEMLKLSDKDFEKLGMTIGARRKLRVNLEILRKNGCFSSDGLRVLDVLPVSSKDSLSSYHAPVISTSSSFNGNGYLCGGYCSDTDFVRGMSESDSASECGSDILSESYPQPKYKAFVPFKTNAPNGCRLSCYNCGSLGHVGGQCMAPNMEKRLNCSYRLKFDGVHSVS